MLPKMSQHLRTIICVNAAHDPQANAAAAAAVSRYVQSALCGWANKCDHVATRVLNGLLEGHLYFCELFVDAWMMFILNCDVSSKHAHTQYSKLL